MSKVNTNKCEHENCSCTVTDGGDYCSPHCETMKDSQEIACECGHSGCSGEVAQKQVHAA
jgi:hypothetical protein